MAPSAISMSTPSSPAADLEAISDAVDEVNVLKNQTMTAYDTTSAFDSTKDKTQFRQYTTATARVQDFYYEQHAKQTVAYNLAARVRFNSDSRIRKELSVWEALERLNALTDPSDPDTSLSQIQHALQTAEAIRRDGKPRWMQAAGLIHDLGKLMLEFGLAEGQWDVVGDSFPVGCPFDDSVIFHEAFALNPDDKNPVYSSGSGIYESGCGIENLLMSWGHDEFLYLIVKDQSTLPPEALAMIRYHSFYAWHREGAYRHFMAEKDCATLNAVQAFSPYDLYSKSDEPPEVEELKPYYLHLLDEFFPSKIKW